MLVGPDGSQWVIHTDGSCKCLREGWSGSNWFPHDTTGGTNNMDGDDIPGAHEVALQRGSAFVTLPGVARVVIPPAAAGLKFICGPDGSKKKQKDLNADERLFAVIVI